MATVARMQTQDPETYTAALRRLADERASGLLTTAAGPHTVVVRLEEGRTTGIGPLHGDATDLDDPVLRATIVQRLLERLVDGVVRETASWSFEDGGDEALAPVPDSLPAELSRRAVDAATSLRRLGEDAVLRPDGPPGMGEAASVLHGALDGSSTLAEVAAHVQRPLTAVAGLAVALLSSGRASLVTPDPPAAPAPAHVVSTPTASTPTGARPTMADLATPKLDDEPAIDWSAVDDDDEPAMWVMAGDDAPTTPATSAPSAPGGTPTTSTLTSADVSGDDWADTSWLDELTPAPGRTEKDPAASTPAQTAAPADQPSSRSAADRDERASSAAEFAGLLGDLAGVGSEPAEPAAVAPEPAPVAAEPDEATTTEAEPGSTRRRRPRGDDVADFLRELSRLALEDDS